MNKEYEEYIREKTKPLRRKSMKILKPPRTGSETPNKDPKEVKFMNFCKKMEETKKESYQSRRLHSAKGRLAVNWVQPKQNRILSTIKSQTDKLSRISTTDPLKNEELGAERAQSVIESPSIDIRSTTEEKDEGKSDVVIKEAVAEGMNTPSCIKSVDDSTTTTAIALGTEDAKSSCTSRHGIESNDREIKQIEMYECLHDEIVMCEDQLVYHTKR